MNSSRRSLMITKLRLDLEDHAVLIQLREDRRDLPLAERRRTTSGRWKLGVIPERERRLTIDDKLRAQAESC